PSPIRSPSPSRPRSRSHSSSLPKRPNDPSSTVAATGEARPSPSRSSRSSSRSPFWPARSPRSSGDSSSDARELRRPSSGGGHANTRSQAHLFGSDRGWSRGLRRVRQRLHGAGSKRPGHHRDAAREQRGRLAIEHHAQRRRPSHVRERRLGTTPN